LKSNRRRHDAIVLDAFGEGGMPAPFMQPSFFKLAQTRLKPRDSLFLMNVIVEDDDDRTPDILVRAMRAEWGRVRLLDTDGWTDRNAVIADSAAQQYGVTSACVRGGEIHASRHHPDSSSRHVYAITRAVLDNFRIASNDGHSCEGCRARHGMGDPPEIAQWKALFQDERRAQCDRPGSAHGKIIYGPVYCQGADISAAEEKRLGHERIRGEGQPCATEFQDSLIFQAFENGVRERRQENAV